MKTIAAFYFSGTGNTRFIVKKLAALLQPEFACKLYDIADCGDYGADFRSADYLLFAFPIYGSSPPVPMRDFVWRHRNDLAGRQAIVVATQFFFSGDGAASLGRFLEKNGAYVRFAEHFNMPDNLADCKFLRIRNGTENNKTVARAVQRCQRFAEQIRSGKPMRRGFGLVSHAVGYLSQRCLWRLGEKKRRKKLKIDAEQCARCGKCVSVCPVQNLLWQDGKPVPQGKCALCYRCVNACPLHAITLIGKSPPKTSYEGVDGFDE